MYYCDGPSTAPFGSTCRTWCTEFKCLETVKVWCDYINEHNERPLGTPVFTDREQNDTAGQDSVDLNTISGTPI